MVLYHPCKPFQIDYGGDLWYPISKEETAMKVLSTRLAMRDGYLPEQFRRTIIEWLKAGPPSKEVGERYETEEITTKPTILKAGYCTLETFILKRPDATYEACKLTHIYREQTWVTEAILKTTPHSESKVYINIDCLGDTTGFDEIPTVRTEIIRAFVKDAWLKEDILPISDEPIMLTGAEVNVVVDAINGSYRGSLPLIFVSKYFDSAGHEVDVQWLAKDLAGIGVVVAEQDDNYLEELKERTNRQNPFNGHIGIYFPHSRNARVYRPSDWRRYDSVNATIIKEVANYITAQTDAEGVSWEQLHGEILAHRAKESEDLLNETINENGTLEDQLKEAKEKLHRAVKETKLLAAQNESLLQALNARDDGRRMLIAAPIDEFFSGEQYDLVVTTLAKVLRTTETNTRAYELLEGILALNALRGEGKEVDETLKRVLSKGENVKERDLLELKAIGFEVVSDSNHYRLIYKGNDKYVVTLHKTPSDARSGKNLVSDILKTISIYR